MNMKKSNVMAAAFMGMTLLATSCKSGQNVLGTNALSGEWTITEVNGQKAVAEKEVFIGLDFKKKNVYGCAGCNRIIGSFEIDSLKPGKLSFDKLGTTRMLCQDMETENAVMGALKEVAGYKGDTNLISLTDKKGKTVITMEKRTANTIESLEGEWLISSVKGTKIEDLGKTEKTPFLAFDIKEKMVHGTGGCNIINGGFTQKDGQNASLQFSQMISTMMAGPGMDVESKILPVLNEVRSFEVKDAQTVALLNDNGEEIITLTKK